MQEGFVLDLHGFTRVLPALVMCCGIPLGIAQEIAERTAPASYNEEARSELSIQPEELALPAELTAESAIYLQRRLASWTEEDARSLLGEPRRHRDAYQEGAVTGDIYAFQDPTSRYREFELLFDRQSKKLTTVFIYPWRMTWAECRELWGEDTSVTKVANGNTFRSYRERRLDVLLDEDGTVVNLGVY